MRLCSLVTLLLVYNFVGAIPIPNTQTSGSTDTNAAPTGTSGVETQSQGKGTTDANGNQINAEDLKHHGWTDTEIGLVAGFGGTAVVLLGLIGADQFRAWLRRQAIETVNSQLIDDYVRAVQEANARRAAGNAQVEVQRGTVIANNQPAQPQDQANVHQQPEEPQAEPEPAQPDAQPQPDSPSAEPQPEAPTVDSSSAIDPKAEVNPAPEVNVDPVPVVDSRPRLAPNSHRQYNSPSDATRKLAPCNGKMVRGVCETIPETSERSSTGGSVGQDPIGGSDGPASPPPVEVKEVITEPQTVVDLDTVVENEPDFESILEPTTKKLDRVSSTASTVSTTSSDGLDRATSSDWITGDRRLSTGSLQDFMGTTTPDPKGRLLIDSNNVPGMVEQEPMTPLSMSSAELNSFEDGPGVMDLSAALDNFLNEFRPPR